MKAKLADQYQEVSCEPDWHTRLICSQCGMTLTHPSYRTSVDGHYHHIQCNPFGEIFLFECYKRAPGTLIVGRPTPAATWFPGRLWQLAICQGCGAHIGWWYSNQHSEIEFAGLLSEKLKRVDSREA